MLGIYNYTVILTYLGMLSSFTGISFATAGNIQAALVCLMISGLCDMFDGKIASMKVRTVREKQFGIQIDSLSDLICFGVLPAVIVCRIAGNDSPAFYISGLYLLSALIRLAWFNVDEEERQQQEQGPREVYLGLPVTTVALFLPVVICISKMRNWPLPIVSPALLLVLGIAFLVPFRLKKPALRGKIAILLCGAAGLALLLMGADL